MRGRRLSLTVAFAAIVVLCSASLASAAGKVNARPSQRTIADSSLARSIVGAVNAVRVQHGLVPLRPSAALTAAAVEHSTSMGSVGYFAHESADGSAFWQRVKSFYKVDTFRSWSVGENLLWSSPTIDPAGAIKLWLASPEHRANLLAPKWREIGLSVVRAPAAQGVFSGQDVAIVTADFGVRTP